MKNWFPRSLTVTFLVMAFLFSLLFSVSALEKESLDVYRQRRQKVMEQTKDGVVILFGKGTAGLDKFKQENNFMYLTGVETPGAILVLNSKQGGETLYVPRRDPNQERWTGLQIGPDEQAIKLTGIGSVKSRDEFQGDFNKLTETAGCIYTLFPSAQRDVAFTGEEEKTVEKIKAAAPFVSLKDVAGVLAELRRAKSENEVRLLQRAVDITGEALKVVAQTLRPGMYEYEAQAVIEYVFTKNGAERPGYPSIVGSGFNSTVLHYNDNRRRMQEGDLVVIDVGAEYSYYTADITRTYPVGGKFTPRQREIYQIVLDAQKAAMAKLKPGVSIKKGGDLYQTAYDYINTHGKDSKGEPLGKYFIHGLGHYLGMNVHDVGGSDKPLKAGEVITIEPGIYIPEENLGVRIEDDFLVTESGYVHLSKNIPRQVDDVEDLLKKSRPKKDLF